MKQAKDDVTETESTPSIRIRRARPEDAPACAELVFAALRDYGVAPEPLGADRDVFGIGSRGGRFVDLVAERPSEASAGGAPVIVGVACLEPSDSAGWISKLFVSRAARGAGVGRALLVHLLDAARAQGMTSVGLRTRSIFREAVGLYEATGFVRDEDPPQRGLGEDRVYTLRL